MDNITEGISNFSAKFAISANKIYSRIVVSPKTYSNNNYCIMDQNYYMGSHELKVEFIDHEQL